MKQWSLDARSEGQSGDSLKAKWRKMEGPCSTRTVEDRPGCPLKREMGEPEQEMGVVLLLAEQRRGWSLMIFCARATRGRGLPSLDARSGRSIRPHP
ncbi:MAG: hypothetical protein JW395_2334 [Nitrospira sp.]|nr:hypothetical protein [Nitrospira sp.]